MNTPVFFSVDEVESTTGRGAKMNDTTKEAITLLESIPEQVDGAKPSGTPILFVNAPKGTFAKGVTLPVIEQKALQSAQKHLARKGVLVEFRSNPTLPLGENGAKVTIEGVFAVRVKTSNRVGKATGKRQPKVAESEVAESDASN